MSYMEQTDMWLSDALRAVHAAHADDVENIIEEVCHAIKDKILDSYHNGQEHGKKRKSSGVRKFAGAFAREAVRQATYTSPKRKKYTKYTKPRR